MVDLNVYQLRDINLKEVKMQALINVFTYSIFIGFLFVSFSTISWLCE